MFQREDFLNLLLEAGNAARAARTAAAKPEKDAEAAIKKAEAAARKERQAALSGRRNRTISVTRSQEYQKELDDRAEAYRIAAEEKAAERAKAIASGGAVSDEGSEQEEEEKAESGHFNPYFFSLGTGYPPALYEFFQFFIESSDILPGLGRAIEFHFDPAIDTVYQYNRDILLDFYLDFEDCYNNKILSDSMSNILEAFREKKEGELAEIKQNAQHGKFVSDEPAKVYAFLTRSRAAKITPKDEDTLKDELDDFFVSCNIFHWYSYLKYTDSDQRGEDNNFSALLFKDDEDASYLNSKKFRELGSITPDALSNFLASDSVFSNFFKEELKSKDPDFTTEFETSSERIARLGKEEDDLKKSKGKVTQRLAKQKRAKEKASNFEVKDGVLVRKSKKEVEESRNLLESVITAKDSGDPFHGNFIIDATAWYLQTALLGNSSDDIARKLFQNLIKTMSKHLRRGDVDGPEKDRKFGSIDDVDIIENETDNQFALALDSELYSRYWSDIEAIQKVFGVDDKTSLLSTILELTFRRLPEGSFGKCFYFKADDNGKIEKVDVLDRFRNDKRSKVTLELANMTTFIRDFEGDITPSKMKALLSALPKTLLAGNKVFHAKHHAAGEAAGEASDLISSTVSNQAATNINTLFAKLTKTADQFGKDISTRLDKKIDLGELNPDSEISIFFNLDLVPKEATTLDRRVFSTGKKEHLTITPKVDFASDTASQEIETLFDNWYSVIEDILLPDKSLYSGWGLRVPMTDNPASKPSFEATAKEKWTAFPIFDEAGVDISKMRKSGHNIKAVIYDDQDSYMADAKKLLNTMALKKSEFLRVDSIDKLVALMNEVKANIRPGILTFRSPLTVTYNGDLGKSREERLAYMLDPAYAIPKDCDLTKIDKNNPMAKLQIGRVNVFHSFALRALQYNMLENKIKDNSVAPIVPITPKEEGVTILAYIQSLIEAAEARQPANVTLVPYAIVNMHLRGQVLVAVAELFKIVTFLLSIIRHATEGLDTIVQSEFRKARSSDNAQFIQASTDIFSKTVIGVATKPAGVDAGVVYKAGIKRLTDAFKESKEILAKSKETADSVSADQFADLHIPYEEDEED